MSEIQKLALYVLERTGPIEPERLENIIGAAQLEAMRQLGSPIVDTPMVKVEAGYHFPELWDGSALHYCHLAHIVMPTPAEVTNKTCCEVCYLWKEEK